jgi:hypothetical protein
MMILLILLAAVLFSLFYLFASFSYQILEDTILLKWRILKYVPFNVLRIRIEDIEEIDLFNNRKHIFYGARIWGNPFVKKGIIILLRRGIVKRVFLTPRNPMQFIDEVRRQKATMSGI